MQYKEYFSIFIGEFSRCVYFEIISSWTYGLPKYVVSSRSWIAYTYRVIRKPVFFTYLKTKAQINWSVLLLTLDRTIFASQMPHCKPLWTMKKQNTENVLWEFKRLSQPTQRKHFNLSSTNYINYFNEIQQKQVLSY